MSVAETIEKKLQEAFSPLELEVKDESAMHAGHAGAPEGGESHFAVRIVAETFAGMNRVARQRSIYQVLDVEMKNKVHALALEVKAPSEI